jgi:hypothetical protein
MPQVADVLDDLPHFLSPPPSDPRSGVVGRFPRPTVKRIGNGVPDSHVSRAGPPPLLW